MAQNLSDLIGALENIWPLVIKDYNLKALEWLKVIRINRNAEEHMAIGKMVKLRKSF